MTEMVSGGIAALRATREGFVTTRWDTPEVQRQGHPCRARRGGMVPNDRFRPDFSATVEDDAGLNVGQPTNT